jgi:hypothetical protein
MSKKAFWETKLRLALERPDFEQIFFCWKPVQNKSESGIETGTGAGTETGTGAGTETGTGAGIETGTGAGNGTVTKTFHSRNRNRNSNKSLRIHNTALQRLPVTGKILVLKKIVIKEFLVWGLGSLR